MQTAARAPNSVTVVLQWRKVSRVILPALALFAIAYSSPAATPVKQHKRHHAATAASTPLPRKSTKTAMPANFTAARGTRTSRRQGKISRAPVRSYQQAPTPDRYKEIQQALASKGYFKGEANGQWGADSADALKRFQSDQNLMPDGKINSLSLIALGLGPKRLTAKSEAVPPGQLAPAPAAPSPSSAVPASLGTSTAPPPAAPQQ